MSWDLTVAVYSAIALCLVALGVTAQRKGSRQASLGGFLRRLLSSGWRLPLILGWMFLGWHFFAR